MRALIPSTEQVSSFYRTAMLGLRLLESREGRGQRFGENANARWKSFAGALQERDRLDLLLRAASVTAPLAFAPRSVFAIEGLAEDEAFGPQWEGPPKGLATELFREAPVDTSAFRAALDLARRTWGLPPFATSAELASSLERLSASTRVVLAGADAITCVALAAQGRSDLDLATQAVLVADAPAERQLLGLALLLLQARARGHLLAAARTNSTALRALGFARIDLALVSSDAAVAAREAIRTVSSELFA